jgi:hypothetical protein
MACEPAVWIIAALAFIAFPAHQLGFMARPQAVWRCSA